MQIFGPTVVALCLPLSAMWAAANTNNVHIADPDPQHRRVIPIGQKDLASGKAYGGTSTTTSDTPIDDDSTIATSPTKGTGFNKTSQSDLEMQKLEDGVQGGRTDNVRSEQVCLDCDALRFADADYLYRRSLAARITHRAHAQRTTPYSGTRSN